MTNGKPARPSTLIAAVGHGGRHEEAGLKERIGEERHKLRDRRGKRVESTTEGVHAESRSRQQTLRDPPAPQERVPDVLQGKEQIPPWTRNYDTNRSESATPAGS